MVMFHFDIYIKLLCEILMNESDLKGMTVNERLYILGLFEEFDAAVQAYDKSRIITVLKKAQLTESQALESAETILRNINT